MENEFGRIDSNFLEQIRSVLDDSAIFSDQETLNTNSRDYTEDLHFLPELVVKPAGAEEVAAILKLCNQYNIPVTARGAGTGLSGGALPVKGGLVLSMERMNRILEIDKRNFQATVEPGVINQVFQDTLAAEGLYYPPDPASKGSCFLGGNVAHNSGGPRALKYGVTRDYVLNLQVALASGELIWTGANTLKNSTGYSLTNLMIGSEGTLGIVTKIVFKIIPKPQQSLLMLASFPDAEKACEAVAGVFTAGITPSALEFMEKSAVEASVNRYSLSFNFKPGIEAYLLIEVDGNDTETMMKDCEVIDAVLMNHAAEEVLFAESADEKEALWKIRRTIGETVKAISVYKEEDTVVPRAQLPELLKGVKEIGARYGFVSVCYGHAGDGNLHVNILKGNMSDEDWNNKLSEGIREIFHLCKKLGGTISGEHGIGYVQKEYMDIPFEPVQLDLMRGIKKVFDPKGILNPGKIFPEG